MKLLSKIVSILLPAILFLTTAGCSQKDLNDDAPTTIADKVEVVFDWSKAPGSQANSMALYLYPEDHEMMDHYFNNPNGSTIRSYAGKHTAVCHSNDDPYIHYLRNKHAHGEIEIFTADAAMLVGQGISTRGIPRAEGTEDEPLRFTPTMIYGAQETEIEFRVTSFNQKLVLYPEELVCHYSVEFVDVENLKREDLCIDATISSLAGSFFPGRMETGGEAVSQTFTLSADLGRNSMRSEFLTFGVPSGRERPHKICLYIALKNRKGNFYTFDVSDQVNNAPDPHNVSIKIPGLIIPDILYEDPDDVGGGVSIEVDSWETIHFGIQVGS